jgi:hypothetical protein
MQPYLNAFPIPNGPEPASGIAQFNAGYSNPSSLDATSIRIDQVLTSKLTFFDRFNDSPSTLDQRGPSTSVGNVLSDVQPSASRN